MTIDEKSRSIEASFAMEDLEFDEDCRNRVKNILSGEISVLDAIKELDKKYGMVCDGEKWSFLFWSAKFSYGSWNDMIKL